MLPKPVSARAVALFVLVLGLYTGCATVARGDARTDRIRAVLGLSSGAIVRLPVAGNVAVSAAPVVPIAGVSRRLILAPSSVRSERFALWVELGDGSYRLEMPNAPTTLRGHVEGVEGSVVAASRLDDGLHARLILPGGETHWVEPLSGRVADAVSGEHIVYRNDAVIAGPATCTALPTTEGSQNAGSVAASATSAGMFIAELAIDTDFDYFQDFGTVQATRAKIESIINAVNVQYERDVGITHLISTIIVRTTDTGIYTATDPIALLHQVRSEWISSPIERDLTQLFTGKEIDGSTIGIAWLGATCTTSFGYSLVQSNFHTTFAYQTDLTAHELGHNWGAHHCGFDGPGDTEPCSPTCTSHTMNCSITGSNVFHPTKTIPDILAYRDGVSCLSKDSVRRLTVRAATNAFREGSTLQLTAEASFVYGGDVDVTQDAAWEVVTPGMGSIDALGVYTPNSVTYDTCVSVMAAYTVDNTTSTDDKMLIVYDAETPRSVVSSDPPIGAIDARQPSDPGGVSRSGWKSFDLTFSGEACLVTSSGLKVAQNGGTGRLPTIQSVQPLDARSVRVVLNTPIEAGAWTSLTERSTGAVFWVGNLPGDVDGNGLVEPSDVTRLMDALGGVGSLPALRSTDIDRSGAMTPADVLRAIDLLSGAGVYSAWNGRSLPPS